MILIAMITLAVLAILDSQVQAQTVFSGQKDEHARSTDNWFESIEDALQINADPVMRTIACRVGYQPFAIHSLWRATKIPETEILRAARRLESMGLVQFYGHVIAPADARAQARLHRFAEEWCSSDERCEVEP